MFVVLGTTVAIDLLLAVGIGMIMTSMMFMQRMSNLQLESITATKDNREELPLNTEEQEILANAEGHILLFHINGPMSFGAAKGMARHHSAMQDYDIMLLDLSDVPLIDFTSAKALEDIIIDTRAAGRHVFLVGARQRVYDTLKRQKILRHLESGQIYKQRLDALLHAAMLLKKSE